MILLSCRCGHFCRVAMQRVSKRNFAITVSNPVRDGGAESSLPSLAEQIDVLYANEPPIPVYKARKEETFEQQRARVLYQSRKRGMLENGLLLSAFADRYLFEFNAEELRVYDKLINQPSNDWEIYYWISGLKKVPDEFQSRIMDLLIKFARNEEKESRARQPDLKEVVVKSQIQ